MQISNPFKFFQDAVSPDQPIVHDCDNVIDCRQDLIASSIALKAPVIKINALVAAKKDLVLITDVLILGDGYTAKPEQWHIDAKEIIVKDSNNESKWLSSLIQESKEATYIKSSSDGSKEAMYFDSKGIDKLIKIKDKAVQFKDLISNTF